MTKTILVNQTHKIKDSYFKKIELVTVKDIENKDVQVEKEAYNAYLELKDFLKTKGIVIGVESAFRSLGKQQEVYEEIKDEYGKEYADKIVAPVGTSEHHTGLAIDISIMIDGKYIDVNMEHENYKDEFYEIHKNLKDFGFILRYKEGKESITGYPYEPWHIRYVGKFASRIIEENDYTLEEYLENYSGIVLVNKEKDMTSFDVVNKISHLFGIKRVGHTGTLDPLAEGVLIVAIGKATKVVELLTSTYKEYIAEVKLGIKTDTLDITGKTIATKAIPATKNISEVLKSFKKTYMQEVPIYSAVKVNGKKLYEYARNNIEVELPKKEVTIKEIELLDEAEDTFKFRALVSKGCYIRSLINDIGLSLNTYATMTSLTRTKQAKITLAETSTLNDIENNNFKVYRIDEVLDLESIVVNKEIAKKIRAGQSLENNWHVEDKVIFKDDKNNILGIYEQKNNKLIVWKNFV